MLRSAVVPGALLIGVSLATAAERPPQLNVAPSCNVAAGAVSDLAGTTTDAGTLDQFLVSSTLAPQSPLSPALMPAARELKAAATSLDAGADDKLGAVGL